MYTVRDQRLIYDAIISRLTSETGKNIGDAVAPDDLTYPYAVVYPFGEDFDPDRRGTLADPQAVSVVEFQITSVGTTREQAQWMAHQAQTALAGWTPTVTGHSFGPVQATTGEATRRDDDVQPPLFYTVDQYQTLTN